jgi:hypothetical protein
MPVRELLATHTARELSEWQAFDRVHGFGDARLEDVLAAIHEQLQLTNHLLGAAHFTPEDEPEENPVPPPERYPRGGDPPKEDPED